ncbi:MAG: DUF5320 domain-containing protein [Clostridiales bacterium]|jgi:cbb3-type cytochrome oxidase subunit 3|nr:DUF5320 domain-containing protein [Clostridiales bacterium]
MKKLSKLETYGLAAVLMAACFYGYLTWVYDPARQALAAVENQIQLVQSEIDRQGGVPPDTTEAKETIDFIKEEIEYLQEELEEIRATAKADTDPAVTEAMALFDQLAANNSLSVKQLKYDKLIYELGKEPQVPRSARRRNTRARVETEPPTVRERFGWQEYTLAVSGSQSGLTGFMGEMAEATWLVRVNKLRVNIIEQKSKDKKPEVGEYDLSLKLIL